MISAGALICPSNDVMSSVMSRSSWAAEPGWIDGVPRPIMSSIAGPGRRSPAP